MFFLTEDALLVCKHELGKVRIEATQGLVTIGKRKVLVESDPEGRTISGCPLTYPIAKRCDRTLAVQLGYSDLLRIEGRRVCLDTVTGLTDGSPPGTVKYEVRQPGQDLVSEVP
jgi:hypothetical protein